MIRARKLLAAQGFTLIEILVVIVIIGVLSIMGVSKYTEFTTESRKRACVSNQNSIDKTIGVWESQNAAIPAAATVKNVKFNTNGVIVASTGVDQIAAPAGKQLKAAAPDNACIVNYTKDFNLFACPERVNVVGGTSAIHIGSGIEDDYEWRISTAQDVGLGNRTRGTTCLGYGDTAKTVGPDQTAGSLHR
jgi:prepilin-type N-terminal cleavage/methylation domain-containing protein